MEHYKRLKRELVRKGAVIDYYKDTIEINGEKLAYFDFVGHKGAAAMIPVDADGKIILVRQYRNAIDQYTLEIPAGGLNPGEESKICAMRECEEETGYKPGETHHLIDLYTTVAFSNEKISIYYTNELIATNQNLDEDEYVTVERYSIDELTSMIFEGKIVDAKTISGILAYKNKMAL
ncbi:MAG: NUDIX hydrolase [Clostridiales bacterium]|nr:NUDIX hydrolase [Clostridiales bacterium]